VSRLNDKEKGSIVAVVQRLHENDLAGHLLASCSIEHLNLVSSEPGAGQSLGEYSSR
jgi:hypothetical protein